MSVRIPFNKSGVLGRELDYMAQAATAGDGHFLAACERFLEQRYDATRVLLTTSCTSALELAAMLCDLEHGDEVILPSYTFVSTANAFHLQGARPVFVDIRPDTLNLDERLVEAAVTDRTRVLAPVHYAGVTADMAPLGALARKYELRVVEDAAQAVDARYDGAPAGTLGDFGCFSFHETKNFVCGEGGALVLRDPDLVARAELIRDGGTNQRAVRQGQCERHEWTERGSSCRLPELLAAYLYAQLENMERITRRRGEVYTRYLEALAPLAQRGDLELPVVPSNRTTNYHLFHVLLENGPARAALIEHLKKRGVQAVFHYVSLHTSPMGRELGYRPGMLPVTEDVSDRLLRLPFFFDLTDARVDEVVAAIFEFFEGRRPAS